MDEQSENSLPTMESIQHEYYMLIWEQIKRGELENLDGERKVLGQLMLEHPQYQYYWEIPYPFAQIELGKIFEEKGIDPDIHLVIEEEILKQLENTNCPDVLEAYNALLEIGQNEHEARHVLGRVLMTMIWESERMVKNGQQPENNFYLSRVKYVATHPVEVIRDEKQKY